MKKLYCYYTIINSNSKGENIMLQ